MNHAIKTRAELDDAHASAAPHLKPIIVAVRDLGCGMMFVGQSDEPFRLPSHLKRPAIVILGDDMHEAVGPDGFHLPSLRRVIRACDVFAVIACGVVEDVYKTMAATAALSRRNVLLVETRPEQEIQWMTLIRKLAPKRHIYFATVEGGHA